ncbi:MAG: HAD-IC family P-type ATPase [Patescibacteria group bacterium]
MENNWYTKSPGDVLSGLRSSDHGLSDSEATKRSIENGPNVLPETKPDNLVVIFLRQFQSPLIYILFAASIIIFIIDGAVDGSIILAVLAFNAVIGTIQEGRAQNTLRALKRFVETKAIVLRDGTESVVLDTEVVVGDIVILQEGAKIPADARILSATNLKVDESALTGESESVQKVSAVIDKVGLSTAEQKNMVFKGTHIVTGNGRAVVVATGLETVIGRIAKEISAVDTEIPLKANIRYLSELIVAVVAIVSIVLFSVGLFFGKPAIEMFATVVSLAVSIIPEGLPIVMTLVLATGVWRMGKRNVLVKKLQAVEALGQARVIAVDKTGTLTKNEMVIRNVYVAKKFFEIGGVGYELKGDVSHKGTIVEPLNHPELVFAAKMATLCASGRVMYSEKNQQWLVSGDPTEASMFVFGQKLGFHKDELEHESPLVSEIPFDYKLKYHATVHLDSGRQLLVAIGAPEVILKLCSKVWHGGQSREFLVNEREELESVFLKMSDGGLRVLAFAESINPPQPLEPHSLNSLTFGGFFGIKDSLRSEVPEAMARAKSAGIKVVMITGDHKITAQAIGKEAGIWKEGDLVLTGEDIDALSSADLERKLNNTSVFARVTPEHKLRIIQAYKSRGEIVAMTGDGVNDAPSLVAADLGVAMGKIGTEVSKEASDIVLLDDNFGSIISAVEEGRSIYKTIKKVILYLFSTSIGEVLVIGGALLLGLPLPILPAQIIWLNFITDGFLDVSLAMEPKEKGLLLGNFERPKKYLIDKLMAHRMIFMALPMMIGTLYLFKVYVPIEALATGFDSLHSSGSNDIGMTKAWTMALTLMAVFQWFNAWNCRSEEKSIFQINPFSNKFLIAATGIVILLQLTAVYNPFVQGFLHTTSLSLSEWGIIIVIASSIIFVEEVRKFFYRRGVVKRGGVIL